MGNINCDCFIDSNNAYNRAKLLLSSINFNTKYDERNTILPEHYPVYYRSANLLRKCLVIPDANYLLGLMYIRSIILPLKKTTKVGQFTSETNFAIYYMRNAANKGHTEAETVLLRLQEEEKRRYAEKHEMYLEQQKRDIARAKYYLDLQEKRKQERARLIEEHPEIPILEQISAKQDAIKESIERKRLVVNYNTYY